MELDQQTIQSIREQALSMERGGTIAPEVLQIIIERGWFKLFVPESLDGKMTALPEALRIFEYASWVEGNFGWLITIGAGGGYFASYLQPDTARAIFKPSNAVIAGSGTPSGTAVRTEDGYLVNGQWKYCSGAPHATTFTGNCVVIESDQDGSENQAIPANPVIRAFAFQPDQVKIIYDWQAFGLKATDSHSIVVKDQFVPDERTFDLMEQHDYLEEPIYRYPFLPFAQSSFAAVSLGICQHLLDEARALVDQHHEAWDAGKPGRSEFVRDQIEQAERGLILSRQSFYDTLSDSWEQHINNKLTSEDEIQRISQVCQQTSRTALRWGQQVFGFLGMSAIMEDEPINKLWRDLQTACQHSLLVPFGQA